MAELPTSNDFADRLETLRAAYRQRLDTELAELKQRLHNCQTEAQPNLLPLQASLHKLAGSSGTFGYEQFGRLARQYEIAIANLLSEENADTTPNLDTTDWHRCLCAALQQDDLQRTAPGVSISLGKQDTDQAHVALVERDAILAEYTAQQLESFGFRVTCLQNANELSELKSEQVDLLLVDHRAGNIEQISKNSVAYWQQQLAHITCPIFFTGAEESFQARLNALRSHGGGYFVKPLNTVELTSKIAQLLSNKDAEPERVLIVGDEPDFTHAHSAPLKQAGILTSVLLEPSKLLSAISSFNPEIILLTLIRDTVTGTELSAILEQIDRWAHTPVLYLCTDATTAVRQQAMLLTNCTLIEKPIDDALLVGLCRARVKKVRQLEASRNQDGLTGLLKHASIKDALQTHWEHVQRHPNTHFSVVMLDIDHFKRVNDTYGHAVGDIVIAAVGTLLRQRFRRVDKLGRYGGEEFTLVLVDCIASDAMRMVEELREAFASIQFTANGVEFSCTLSAGVVDNRAYPNDPPQTLLERADKALYTAKHNGRNQVCQASD